MKRFDPVTDYTDRYGVLERMQECTDGDYVLASDAMELLEALKQFVDDVENDIICVKPSDREKLIATLTKANKAIYNIEK